MFCPKCGTESSANSSFCGHCGCDLRNLSGATQTVADAVKTPTDDVQTAFAAACNQSAPVQSQTPADWDTYFLGRWKRFLCSPIILAMLACATILQVMTISELSSLSDTMSMMKSLSYSLGMGRDFAGILDLVIKGVMLYGILMIGSMWLVFFDGQKGGPRLNTAGITVIQVLQTILLVLLCAGLGYVAYTYMDLMGEINEYSSYSYYSYYSSYYKSVKAELNKSLLYIDGAGIFLVVFLTRVLSLLKSVKSTLQFHVPAYKGAMFVGVVEILSGLGLFYMITNYTMGGMNLLMILSLAAPFLYGIAAISYGNLMKNLEVEYMNRSHNT